ncbi:hypothetical protein D3C75_1207840 [compost metagenome]
MLLTIGVYIILNLCECINLSITVYLNYVRCFIFQQTSTYCDIVNIIVSVLIERRFRTLHQHNRRTDFNRVVTFG